MVTSTGVVPGAVWPFVPGVCKANGKDTGHARMSEPVPCFELFEFVFCHGVSSTGEFITKGQRVKGTKKKNKEKPLSLCVFVPTSTLLSTSI